MRTGLRTDVRQVATDRNHRPDVYHRPKYGEKMWLAARGIPATQPLKKLHNEGKRNASTDREYTMQPTRSHCGNDWAPRGQPLLSTPRNTEEVFAEYAMELVKRGSAITQKSMDATPAVAYGYWISYARLGRMRFGESSNLEPLYRAYRESMAAYIERWGNAQREVEAYRAAIAAGSPKGKKGEPNITTGEVGIATRGKGHRNGPPSPDDEEDDAPMG